MSEAEAASRSTPAPPAPPVTRRELALLASILLLALGLRLWALGEVPPGLHVDEGHNGVDALRIARGWRPMFLPGNDGREALYSYVQAPLVSWLGPTAFALRLASALLGVAGVWATWLWVRRLPLAGTAGARTVATAARFTPTAALATAFVTATTYWHLHFSRIAIRGILLPLIACLAASALWGALRDSTDRRLLWPWIATGALYALAFYAHPAGRLLALVPLPPLLWLAWRAARRGDRGAGRALLRGGGTAALTAAVVLLPLGLWAARHPEVFFAHSVSVSVLDPAVHEGEPLRRIAVNAWRTLRALAWRGSGSWYHNLRDRPVLDPLTALLWAGGALWLARAAWRAARRGAASREGAALRGTAEVQETRGPAEAGGAPPAHGEAGRPLVGAHDPVLVVVFLGGWLLAMALPTVLTSGAPNFSRAIGLLPAVLLPAGLAIAAAAAWARRRGVAGLARALGLAALLAPGALATGYDHFVRYARAAEPAEAFGAVTRAKAVALRALAHEPGRVVLSSPIIQQRAVLRYLSDGAGPSLLPAPRPADLYAPAVGRAVYAFDAGEEREAALRFVTRWPEVAGTVSSPDLVGDLLLDHAARTIRDAKGNALWLLLDGPDPPNASAARAMPEGGPGLPVFDETLALRAIERREGGAPQAPPFTASPGDRLSLVLWWEVLRPPRRDWTRFSHLIGAEGDSFGQQDGAPFGGRLPTGRWRTGDRVATWAPIEVDAATPPGAELAIRVGWYDPATGERLPLPGDADAAAEVATVRVR